MTANETLSNGSDPANNNNWISCSDLLPAEPDSDCEGDVWVFMPIGFMGKPSNLVFRIRWHTVANRLDHLTHWMPTGLKRPETPQLEGYANE